jgi:hypothetical protein
LSFSISFINVTTTWASARGVARVNRDHLDACMLSFVFNKASKLGKRPARKGSSLRLTNRYPITNPAKFLNGDPATGVFGLVYNFFADVVVCPSGKAPFFARKFFKRRRAECVPFF